MAALDTIRYNEEGFEEAMATLETFCSMALELISISNPSTVRKVAQNAELRSLIPPSLPK